MNTEQMKIFIAVADSGSFSKAESKCFMSKQAMIKQIQNLENEIGCTLFIRSRHGIEMTDEGKLFYKGSTKIIEDEKNLMLSILKKSGHDILRIGSAQQHQTLLDRVTSEFTLQYPQITIQKIIHPNHSGEYRIENNIQDVAESFLGDVPASELPYQFQKLIDLPYVAVIDPSHPLAHKNTVSLNEISDYPLTILEGMISKQYVNEIEHVYQTHPNLFRKSHDYDHQVELVYECLNTNQIVIGANPFLYQLPEVKKIPLDTHWKRTYGIIYQNNSNWMIQKYIELAVQIYQSESFDFIK